MRDLFKGVFLALDGLLMCCGLLQILGIEVNSKAISEHIITFLAYDYANCIEEAPGLNYTVGVMITQYFSLILIGFSLIFLTAKLSVFENRPSPLWRINKFVRDWVWGVVMVAGLLPLVITSGYLECAWFGISWTWLGIVFMSAFFFFGTHAMGAIVLMRWLSPNSK